MKEQLEKLRVQLDGILKLSELSESGEIYGVTSSIKFAKAYVGKVLGSIGIPSPYKNDGNRRTIEDIEPTDAISPLFREDAIGYKIWEEKTLIGKVDLLRETVQNIINKSEALFDEYKIQSRHEAVYRTQVFINLTDARLWLGFELQRIRENG